MSNDTYTTTIDSKNTAKAKTNKTRPEPLILKLFRLAFHIGNSISPKLAGCAAYKLWITPPRFKLPASEQKVLKSAQIEYHKINEQSIASYHWGQSGPTILLVHGWSGRGTQLGAFAEPLVNAGYQVLSFDAPAHGKSTGKQTNIYEIANAILALNDIYGPFESVITHSFGGPCLAIAMQKGLNTLRVVNISPPAATEGLVKKFTLALSIPKKTEKELMRCIEDNFGKNIWQETSMENNIRDLKIPALVIHDVDDVDVPWHEGQTIAQAWSEVRFIKTSKLGHRRILRDSATIETAVDFVKSGFSRNH